MLIYIVSLDNNRIYILVCLCDNVKKTQLSSFYGSVSISTIVYSYRICNVFLVEGKRSQRVYQDIKIYLAQTLLL